MEKKIWKLISFAFWIYICWLIVMLATYPADRWLVIILLAVITFYIIPVSKGKDE